MSHSHACQAAQLALAWVLLCSFPFLPPSWPASAALGDTGPVYPLTEAASSPDAESVQRHEQMVVRLWTGEGDTVS